MGKEDLEYRPDNQKILHYETAISAAIWSAVSAATILAAAAGSRQNSQETKPDDHAYEQRNERQIKESLLSEDHFLEKLERMEETGLPTPETTIQPTLEPTREPPREPIDSPEEVLTVMRTRPEQFSPSDLEDVSMYYPIYEAVGKVNDIDWYLIWIIHRSESTCSEDPNAFEPGRLHYGAMQRAITVHEQYMVESAAVGLEYLSQLPQRHFDDWKEIAWATKKLRGNADQGVEMGYEPIQYALLRYSAAGPAYERYALYQSYQQVFE